MLGVIFGNWLDTKHIAAYVVIAIVLIAAIWYVSRGRAKT